MARTEWCDFGWRVPPGGLGIRVRGGGGEHRRVGLDWIANQETFVKRPSLVIAAFQLLDLARCKPRPASTLGWHGWLHDYDANVVGGLLQGAGMLLSCACPGTLLIQLALGVRRSSSWLVLVGAVAGAVAYTGVGRARGKPLSSPTSAPSAPGANDTRLETTTTTVDGKLRVNATVATFAFQALCLAVIWLATSLGPTSTHGPLRPLQSGLAIGAAQAASLLLTGIPVGVSAVYSEIGEHVWRIWDVVRGGSTSSGKLPTRGLTFASGILAGAWLLGMSGYRPGVAVAGDEDAHVSALRALLGGCVMVVGARLAGGCTSGHGISGMSLLSISSFVTVASMFFAGVSLAPLLSS